MITTTNTFQCLAIGAIAAGLLATNSNWDASASAQTDSAARTPFANDDYKVFLPNIAAGKITGGNPTVQPPPLPTKTPHPEQRPRGFFAQTDWLSYNADTAVDPQGMHLAFYLSDERHPVEKRGQPAYYVYCPGSTAQCSDPSNWGGMVQFSSQVNEVQLVSTRDGRPLMLIRRDGNSGQEYEYWACEQACANASSWAGVFVTAAAGFEYLGTSQPQHSFALDAQERPRFIYSNGWGNSDRNGVWDAYCIADDCTQPGAWTKHQIVLGPEFKTLTSDYTTLVFDGVKPRVLTRLNLSGLPDKLVYLSCEDGCDSNANWSQAPVLHPESKQWDSWDLALDEQGRPHVTLFEAAPIDINVGGKLFYGMCKNPCGANADWQLIQIASGEGRNPDLGFDANHRAHVVYDAGQRGVLGVLWCATNCSDTLSWQRRILESSADLMQVIAPASPAHCEQALDKRAWLDAIPELAFDGAGHIVVAYDVKNVAICLYTDPGNPGKPPSSRVERLWWAVRWITFDQP